MTQNESIVYKSVFIGRWNQSLCPHSLQIMPTEIVYSHLLDSGRVKIYVEKSDEHDGFHHAACFLPGCRWEDIVGFSDAEIQEYQKVIEASAEQITRLAASGKG